MNVTFAIFQWTTLAVILSAIALRIWSPRKRNATVLTALIFLAFAVVLAIPMIYSPTDQALGGKNIANLILRLFLFAAFFLLGVTLSRGYGSRGVIRAISGPLGFIALGLSTAVVLAAFVVLSMSDGPSSAGLLAQKQLGVDAALVYGVAGYAYPAYVAVVLVGSVYENTRLSTGIDRVANMMLVVALVGIVLLPVLQGIKIELSLFSLGKLFVQYAALSLIAGALTILHIIALRQPASRTPSLRAVPK